MFRSNKYEQSQKQDCGSNNKPPRNPGVPVVKTFRLGRVSVRPHCGFESAPDFCPREPVQDHSGEGDAVTKCLQRGDGGTPYQHRGDDQEDILEDTAEVKNQCRRFANLECELFQYLSLESL